MADATTPHTPSPQTPSPHAPPRPTAEPSIRQIESLLELVAAGDDLAGRTVHGVSIPAGLIDWSSVRTTGAVMVACDFDDRAEQADLVERGCLVIPRFDGLAFDPGRTSLYTAGELAEPSSADASITVDEAIWNTTTNRGQRTPMIEALAERLHDHAIDDALDDALERLGHPPAVGIMGGHSTRRDDDIYRTVARLAHALARRGFLVATGGGPGSMEAGNLGAHLATSDDPAIVDAAVDLLATAPAYTDDGYREAAREVLAQHPDGAWSLAIPTWFYGHEPTNEFASGVAKYFANSIREDRLLALCHGGIAFTPGSAGTAQEVFQDAAQNHYETFGAPSAMVFLGSDHWERTGLVTALRTQAAGRAYGELIWVTDSVDDAVTHLVEAWADREDSGPLSGRPLASPRSTNGG